MIICLLLYDRLFITVITLHEDRRQCIFSRHLVFSIPPLREHYPDTKRIAVKRSISFKRHMSMATIDRSIYQNSSSYSCPRKLDRVLSLWITLERRGSR